jgi:hypothetical protein
MHLKLLIPISLIVSLLIIGCSKKQVPQHTATITVKKAAVNKNATPTVTKKVVNKIPAPPLPRVIVVNDSAAKKSFDGRLYYDIEGHRYWRNYNDGKYYLFNKSMYADSAFKPH